MNHLEEEKMLKLLEEIASALKSISKDIARIANPVLTVDGEGNIVFATQEATKP